MIEQVLAAGRALGLELNVALPSRQREVLEQMIQRVPLTADGMRIELQRGYLGERLLGDPADATADPIIIEAEVDFVRRGIESRLVVEARSRHGSARDDSLVRAIACGRAWFEELASGRAGSFGDIAARVGVSDRYVSRIVDLAFLAPDVVEAVLNGDQRSDVTVKGLTVDGSVPTISIH